MLHIPFSSREYLPHGHLGDLGTKLFTSGIAQTSGVLRLAESVPIVKNLMKVPKLHVGTVEIRFSPSLFVTYNASWPIARKLQTWRTSLGLSQRDFANVMGFGPGTIQRWEKGRRLPDDDHIARIRFLLAKIMDHLEN